MYPTYVTLSAYFGCSFFHPSTVIFRVLAILDSFGFAITTIPSQSGVRSDDLHDGQTLPVVIHLQKNHNYNYVSIGQNDPAILLVFYSALASTSLPSLDQQKGFQMIDTGLHIPNIRLISRCVFPWNQWHS